MKEEKKERKEEKKDTNISGNPIVNLQIYESKPAFQPSKKPPPTVYQPFPGMNIQEIYAIPNAPSSLNQFMSANTNPYNITYPPILKEYNISLAGPTGDHLRHSVLYEDVLPDKSVIGTYDSLSSRKTMYEYVRSRLFTNGDGEDVSWYDNTPDSIFNKFKLTDDVNPYNENRLSWNKYAGLPDGFLLYMSCWPIRYDQVQTVCAKESTGINVRIYRLTEGAYNIYGKHHNSMLNYDQWRELYFYKYIRQHILDTKVCPHFAGYFGFYISLNSGIDFNKILLAKNGKQSCEIDNILKQKNDYVLQQLYGPCDVEPEKIKLERERNEYKGKVLVILTEAQTYTLYGWSRITYSQNGNVFTTVNTGYHKSEVWNALFFQLMYTLLVMNKYGIAIKNYSLKKNVLVKDLKLSGPSTKYWKYIINGIEYYIPNYGYMIIIDSDYQDPEGPLTFPFQPIKHDPKLHYKVNESQHKLQGTIFKDYNKYNETDLALIRTEIIAMMRKSFDPDLFRNDFVNDGCTSPGGEALNHLTSIINYINKAGPNMNLNELVLSTMNNYLHSRTGTLLRENEIQNIRKNDKNFATGDMIVNEESYQSFVFVIFVNDLPNNQCLVYTADKNMKKRDNTWLIPKHVSKSLLYGYNKYEPILQEFKVGEPSFSEEDLIETYIL